MPPLRKRQSSRDDKSRSPRKERRSRADGRSAADERMDRLVEESFPASDPLPFPSARVGKPWRLSETPAKPQGRSRPAKRKK